MNRMTKTFLFALPHSVVVVCEILVVLAVIAAGGITYGLARLAQGPVDVGFAKKYIEDTLSGGGQMIAVNVTRATLSWPNMTGPILLDLKGLSITDQGRDVADVQDISLAVAKLPLLVGRIRPERLILNNPTVTVVRDPSNRMRMDLGTVDVGRVQMSGGASVGLGGVMAYVLGDDRAALGVLSHIDQIEIRQARIRVIDERLGMTWQLPRVAVTLQNVDVGVMGTATIQLLNGQTLDARVSYQRENDVLIFDGRFRDFSLPAFAGRLMGAEWVRRQHLPMTGAVKIVAGLKTPRLQSISVDATADQGTMDLGSEIGVQVPVRDFVLKLAYQHDQDSWDIPQLDFVAADIPVRAKLDLSPVKDHGVRGDLVVQIDSLAQQKLAELWPKTARDTPVARWVLDKISRVQFRDIAVTVPVVANMNNRQLTLLALHPRATWAFRGLDLNYRPPLPVLTDARGTGVYENDALEISVAGGVIHGLDVTGSTVRIDDLAKAGAGQAHLDLTLKGPVKDALDYIATDPIAIKDRLPIKTDAVKGQGDIHAVVTFPTLKDLPKDLIEADVTTTLRDITVPNVAGGLDLTGGPFDVAVVDGMASFKGAGAFGGQPITIDWAEPMSMGAGKSGARGRVTVETNDAMRTALGAAFDGVQGLMPVTLDYKAGAKNTATVAVKVDLTPARLNIREFGYEKVPGQKASAALTLGLQNGAVKTAKNVTITAPRLSVSSGALTFGQIGTQRTIVRASVPRLKLGASDASVLYTRDAKNMDVTIKGKRFDLGPFLSTKGIQHPRPRSN
jgi:uncharacterized protein YhdP